MSKKTKTKSKRVSAQLRIPDGLLSVQGQSVRPLTHRPGNGPFCFALIAPDGSLCQTHRVFDPSAWMLSVWSSVASP